MREAVITTMGHVDHGKTSLIYNLTGRDTDTLKEEKIRGLSIDLGFTYIDLPSKLRAGIVDVPGHDKFMKNMLAGVFGADIALLVIDINEGIMMQTKEHIEIITLLGIKYIAVILTKVDLIENKNIESSYKNIERYIKKIFPSSPIIEISNKTKEGLDKVIEFIDKACMKVIEKEDIFQGSFYMPVDRSFSLKGHGTVVTGTFQGDGLKNGDEVMIYPKKIKVKIRAIQNHNKNINTIEGRARVAINLSNIKAREINRGDLLTKINSLENSNILDVSFKYIPGNKPLKNQQRIRIHFGTTEVFGRVKILGKESVNQGEEALTQLILEKEVSAIKGEKFIARNFSEGNIIGGGVIINPCGKKIKRNHYRYKKFIEGLHNSINIGQDMRMKTKYKDIFSLVDKYHKKYPYSYGIEKEKLIYLINSKKYSHKKKIVNILVEDGFLVEKNNRIRLDSFYIKLSKTQEKLVDNIYNYLDSMKLKVPKIKTYIKNNENFKDFNSMINLLMEEGRLMKLNEDYVVSKEAYKYSINLITDYLKKNTKISVYEAKEILNAGRKITVVFLEHLDYQRITIREDDGRRLNKL